jgi:hypothetical protein
LSLAEERATGETKRFLEAVGRGSLAAEESAGRLARVLADLGIEDAARRLLERYRREAVTALEPLPSEGLRNVLERVVGKMFAGEGAFKRGMRNSECGRKEHGERSTADAQPRGAAGARSAALRVNSDPPRQVAL